MRSAFLPPDCLPGQPGVDVLARPTKTSVRLRGVALTTGRVLPHRRPVAYKSHLALAADKRHDPPDTGGRNG